MKKEFIKEFERARWNIVYFIEEYYNKITEEKIILSDEEKQRLYNKYKGSPYFSNFADLTAYKERVEELKSQGYKDWEIF